MNLRWLVKQDGTRVLQVLALPTLQLFTAKNFVWTDIPEVREEKDPIMASEENSA